MKTKQYRRKPILVDVLRVNGECLFENGSRIDRCTEAYFIDNFELAESFLDRLKIEYEELKEKYQKLKDFMLTSNFDNLTFKQMQLLIDQEKAMFSYLSILEERIKDALSERIEGALDE